MQTVFAGKPDANLNRNVSANGFIENKGQIIDQNNNPNPLHSFTIQILKLKKPKLI